MASVVPFVVQTIIVSGPLSGGQINKSDEHDDLNATKQRIQREIYAYGGVAWVTAGREVENYIDHSILQSAVAEVSSSYAKPLKGGRYDHALHYGRLEPKRTRTNTASRGLKETEVDKVKVARKVVEQNLANLDVLDLRDRVDEIVGMISRANL